MKIRVRLLRHPAHGYLLRAHHPEGRTQPAYCMVHDLTHLRLAEVRRIFRYELKRQLRTFEQRL